MSDTQNTRKVRVKMPQTITINSSTVTEIIADKLRETWGHLRHAPKLLARRLEANERTVSNLLEGRNAPSAALLIRLMKHDDAVFEAVLQMAERDLPPAHNQIKAIKAAIAIMEGKQP